MSCDFLKYELVLGVVAFIAFCYSTTLKHLLASRCTSIRFGCISCDRQPLSDTAAVDVVETSAVMDVVGSPTLQLRSVTV
jgi:hypothetical protein